MRLTTYKKIVDADKRLPEGLAVGDSYTYSIFLYNPKEKALSEILNAARTDLNLFWCEAIELYYYVYPEKKS